MKAPKEKLWQAMSCLVCLAAANANTRTAEGTEFSGGSLTGPLLTMADIGSLLFVVAMLVAFLYPRVAATAALAASLLCLPIYLYFMAPGPFRRAFPGEYLVPLRASFVWDGWAAVGMLSLGLAAYVSFRVFQRSKTRASDEG